MPRSPAEALRFCRTHPLLAAAGVLLGVALLKATFDLLSDLTIVFAAPLWQDSKIYMAAGRGILNGVDLYAEHFESKPFGVFLISAASLALFGDQLLTAVVEAVSLLLLPAVCALAGLRAGRDAGAPAALRGMTGALFGLALTGYVLSRSGSSIQTETVGAAFGAVSVAAFLLDGKSDRFRAILAGVGVFGAVWMKEPFALVLLGCALLLLPRLRDFARLFLLPSAAAAAAGFAILLLLGLLPSYVGVYLGYMTGGHVGARGSPWERGLWIHRLAADLWDYSPWLQAAVALLLALAAAELLRSHDRRRRILRGASLLAALYLSSFAVGLGGQYYPHHFVFAVPLLVALLPLAFRGAALAGPRAPLVGVALAVLLAAQVLLRPLPSSAWTGPWRGGPREAAVRERAAAFDRILDDCEYDRYLPYGWELEDLWAHTRHTPYSSTFTSYRFGLSHTDQFFADIYSAQLNETPLIVLLPERVPELERDAGPALWAVFGREPPACAAPHMPFKNALGEELQLLFRKP